MRALLAQATTGESETKSILDEAVLDEFEVPFGAWIDQSVDWIDNKLQPLLDVIKWPFEALIDLVVDSFLLSVPWIFIVLGMGLLATLIRNIKVGAFVAIALTVCGVLGDQYWAETAKTIGFIAVAVLLCVIIGLPVGVAAGRIDGIWQVIRPILDAMQVVHSFVYMIPFIFFWGIGEVSATMVTMIFALPPLIRLTNLGIRQVPEDVVEASRAYGAPEWRVLFDVQLPLARPAIMTGINQTLLLSISMLGIAAIMGAGGLGRLLFRSLSNQSVSLAGSSGLAFFLVAVVLDRMSQREDSDTGNLFHRIRAAWAHRRDPEALLPDSTETATPSLKPTERIAPIAPSERMPMGLVVVGGLLAAIATFLPWTAGAGKISAFGNRMDESLPDRVISGLEASGGSWFGIVVLALGLFTAASALLTYFRPGKGPRWMTVDGALLASITMLATAAAFLLAQKPPLADDPGTGIGLWLAVAGGLVAVAGSVLWIRNADHKPKRPLRATVSVGRLIGVGIAIIVIVGGAFGGWSFDTRSDVVITPELQAEIDRLQAEAAEDPTAAAVVGNQIAALVAAAQATSAVVIDGVSGEGAGLGIWTLLLGLAGAAATLPAAGVFGIDERRQWIWSSIAAGFGAGIMAITFAWIFTFVRNADPNYLSGIGSFLTLMGGFFIVASTMSVLKEFRRAKIYDDEPAASVDLTSEVAEEPVEQPA